MNKILKALLAASLIFSTYAAYAATTEENTDDGSAIGTSDSPQHKRQESRTDKGPTGVHQDSHNDDATNLGTADSPQHVEQNKRTNKGNTEAIKSRKHSKNKVLRTKEENAGTTKGNPVQPTEPEYAPPTTTN